MTIFSSTPFSSFPLLCSFLISSSPQPLPHTTLICPFLVSSSSLILPHANLPSLFLMPSSSLSSWLYLYSMSSSLVILVPLFPLLLPKVIHWAAASAIYWNPYILITSPNILTGSPCLSKNLNCRRYGKTCQNSITYIVCYLAILNTHSIKSTDGHSMAVPTMNPHHLRFSLSFYDPLKGARAWEQRWGHYHSVQQVCPSCVTALGESAQNLTLHL